MTYDIWIQIVFFYVTKHSLLFGYTWFTRMLETHDEHVFCQPAFPVCQMRSNSEGKTFLAEKRVTAVSGAEGVDVVGCGDVSNHHFVRIAGPHHILDSWRKGYPD